MGAARRNMRRQARLAATQLLKSGVPASAIGAVSSIERLKGTLLKIVGKLDRKLDTGEGEITIREGLAAINSLTRLEQTQSQLGAQEPQEETPEPSESAVSAAESAAQSAAQVPSATQAIMSAAAAPIRATG